jgi:hypothetical protein
MQPLPMLVLVIIFCLVFWLSVHLGNGSGDF